MTDGGGIAIVGTEGATIDWNMVVVGDGVSTGGVGTIKIGVRVVRAGLVIVASVEDVNTGRDVTIVGDGGSTKITDAFEVVEVAKVVEVAEVTAGGNSFVVAGGKLVVVGGVRVVVTPAENRVAVGEGVEKALPGDDAVDAGLSSPLSSWRM